MHPCWAQTLRETSQADGAFSEQIPNLDTRKAQAPIGVGEEFIEIRSPGGRYKRIKVKGGF